MGSLSRLLKNTTLLMASNITTKGLSAIFIIYLARYLEDYGFGQYNFAFSFAAVFIIFSDLGLDALTIKNVARDRDLAGQYLESVGILRIGLSLIMISISLIVGYLIKLDEYILLVILVAGLAYLFDKLSGLFYALFRAFERMEIEAEIQILWKIIQVGLGLGAIYFGFSLLEIMLVLLVSSVIKSIVGFSMLLANGIYPARKGLSQGRIIKQATPFAAYEIGNTIYMNIAIIILFLIQSPEDTGWFSAALRIIMFMLLIPSAFDAAIYPLFSRLYNTSASDMNFIYKKSIKFSLVIAIPISIILAILAEQFTSLFGSGFTNTSQCLFIMAVMLPLYTINMLMKTALWSGDAQNRIAWNIWISLGILTLASYILIEKEAYLGAAMALVIGEFSFLILNYIAARKKGLPMGRDLWKPILGGLGMIATAWILNFVAGEFLGILYITFVATLVYFLIIFATGIITLSDKILFNEALSRRKP